MEHAKKTNGNPASNQQSSHPHASTSFHRSPSGRIAAADLIRLLYIIQVQQS